MEDPSVQGRLFSGWTRYDLNCCTNPLLSWISLTATGPRRQIFSYHTNNWLASLEEAARREFRSFKNPQDSESKSCFTTFRVTMADIPSVQDVSQGVTA